MLPSHQSITNHRLRIGIYAGTFNPVHAGHLAFALESVRAVNLDRVYFLPERRPRRKEGVEHFGHRTAMIARAIQPHTALSLLELPDAYFDTYRTWPKLQKEFLGCDLFLLFGSDIVAQLASWPEVNGMLQDTSLIIGLRNNMNEKAIRKQLDHQSLCPKTLTLLTTRSPYIASTTIRQAVKSGSTAAGLLSSVREYARRHWLYVSLAAE